MMLDDNLAWRAVLAVKDHWHRLGSSRPMALSLDGGTIEVAPQAAPMDLLVAPDLIVEPDGQWRATASLTDDAHRVLDIYLPLCVPSAKPFVVIGHLGQSLDGRIATCAGDSQYVSGPAGLVHLHRLRALSDVVLVGAGTVRCDDPRLTVRNCPGTTGLRAVIDTNRRLEANYRLFTDNAAPTVIYCAEDARGEKTRLADAELVGLPRRGDWLDVACLLDDLRRRGARTLLVEGGGVTVSRFLAAGALDVLQLTVSPILIGSGRPGLQLPAIDRLADALHPSVRRFDMGADLLFECRFDGG